MIAGVVTTDGCDATGTGLSMVRLQPTMAVLAARINARAAFIISVLLKGWTPPAACIPASGGPSAGRNLAGGCVPFRRCHGRQAEGRRRRQLKRHERLQRGQARVYRSRQRQ